MTKSNGKNQIGKTVYIGVTADILHHGHINVIAEGCKYGEVVIGLLADKAVSDHKRLPYLEYEHRKCILENITGVKSVIPQEEWGYTIKLRIIRPDYMIHGDDWITGPQEKYRDLAVAAMAERGGNHRNSPYEKCQLRPAQGPDAGVGNNTKHTFKAVSLAPERFRVCARSEVHNPLLPSHTDQ